MSGKKKFTEGKFLKVEIREDSSSKETQVEEKTNNIGSPIVTLSPLETIFEDAVLTPDSTIVGQDLADMPKDFSALREEIKKDQIQIRERSESIENEARTQSIATCSADNSNSDPVVEKSLFRLGENINVVRHDFMLSDTSAEKDVQKSDQWNVSKQLYTDTPSQSCISSDSRSDSNSQDIDKCHADEKSNKEQNHARIVLTLTRADNKSQRTENVEDSTYTVAGRMDALEENISSTTESKDSSDQNLLPAKETELITDSDSMCKTVSASSTDGSESHEGGSEHVSSEEQSSEPIASQAGSELDIGGESQPDSESQMATEGSEAQVTSPHAGAETSEGESSSSSSRQSWTREEDRLILQTCKSDGANDSSYIRVAQQLSDKTSTQVSGRFRKLMKLFSEPDTTTDGEETGVESDEEQLS